MKRRPSVKSLRQVFGDDAKQARAVLLMSRRELEDTDAGNARVRECYNPPATWDVRMEVLNAISGHTFGVEHCETEDGEFASYLNTGETYEPTVIYWRGKYRVQSLGDFVETLERNRVVSFK
jgi:hypothetical protein